MGELPFSMLEWHLQGWLASARQSHPRHRIMIHAFPRGQDMSRSRLARPDKAKQGGYMKVTYLRYLRSDAWREKGRLVLERDGYRCQL